jgi:hypothetical protein
MKKPCLYLGLFLAMGPMGSPTSSADTANLEARRKELNQLIADEWDYEMRESPGFATIAGSCSSLSTFPQPLGESSL